jgi:phage-related tail fiber protein
MAGTVMAFAYDPINSYDVIITSLGRDYSKVIDVIVSITGRKPEDINALVATLPATIIHETTLANATNIAKQLTEYGATVETPDWLKQHGWLICDGMQYNRFEYSRLFTRIKTLYGSGDGKYTFNVPDYRNQFLRGWNNDEKYPRRVSTSQADQIQSHKHLDSGHTHIDSGHNHPDVGHGHPSYHLNGSSPGGRGSELTNSNGWYDYGNNFTGYANISPASAAIQTNYSNLGDPVDSKTGGGTPRIGNETRPINYAVIFCIKY